MWLQGALPSAGSGVFEGNLVIKGTGDPKLVLERVWLLLRRVQQLGVREIRGDIVLDRSGFEVPEQNPSEFDGEALRPYNVRADALLLNYKSVSFTFTPDLARGVAVVSSEPALDGVRIDARVPLAAGVGATVCADWRGAAAGRFHGSAAAAFQGHLFAGLRRKTLAGGLRGAGCLQRAHARRTVAEMGGKLQGQRARDGSAPITLPTFEVASPPLAEVIRDINKFSNNVMAQQLFLTLALNQRGLGTPDGARAVLQQWLDARYGDAGARHGDRQRIGPIARDTDQRQPAGAAAAGRRGQPGDARVIASLPVSGIDGTMRRTKVHTGRAHLKTGRCAT